MARITLIWLAICCGLSASEITCTLQNTAVCFEAQDIEIQIPAQWLPPTEQMHDAYDADRDQRYFRLDGHFIHKDITLIIPCFFMRKKPDAAWTCMLRWAPTRTGNWTLLLKGTVGLGDAQVQNIKHDTQQVINVTDEGLDGFLQYPQEQASQRYFRISKSDGTNTAKLLHGSCRAWLVSADKTSSGWAAHEYANRKNELLPALREHGYNVLHQWFAPWEYQLVHLDKAEYWRQADDSWKRHPIASSWHAHQSIDQGRASAFDTWIKQLAGNKSGECIYTLLAPLPHVSFQLDRHSWGGEGCWSKIDDPDQRLEKCNGFSALIGGKNIWRFFLADPAQTLESTPSKDFDHQANYFRYLIARWSAFTSVGIWEIFDEIDAIGGEVGLMDQKTAWWSDKRHDQWLENINALFAGDLKRSDGLLYRGDPYQRPLHCATTSHAGGISADSNLYWKNIPDKHMSIGWHWYPTPSDKNILHFWLKTVHGLGLFSDVWKDTRPHFLGEFGYVDRLQPFNQVNILYPSLYHFGIWGSAFNGHAITAMDWDDGKEYGEIRFRQSPGAFDQKSYPINNGLRLDALRQFCKSIDWDSVRISRQDKSIPQVKDAKHQISYALQDKNAVYAWTLLFGDHFACSIDNIKNARYTLQFYDSWTGQKIIHPEIILKAENKSVTIKSEALKDYLIKNRNSQMTKDKRLFKGFDIAWTLHQIAD